MAIDENDLREFYTFALGKIQSEPVGSLNELLDLWLSERPNPDRIQNDVAAIGASIRDMKNGDTGRSATEHIQQLRENWAPEPTQLLQSGR